MSRTTRANIVFSLVLVMAAWSVPTRAADPEPVDLVVYGGTSAGIAAAVQAHRMGKTVIVIEPSQRVGGLTTGGLGQTDIGNKAAIGGIAREFYEDVAEYYQDPAAWKFNDRTSIVAEVNRKPRRGKLPCGRLNPALRCRSTKIGLNETASESTTANVSIGPQ